MTRPSCRALSPAAGVSLSSKAPPVRLSRPPTHNFTAFLAFRKAYTTRPASNARASFQIRRLPYNAMNRLQDGSLYSVKSAATKSPASDAASDDSFDSSLIHAVDDLVSRLQPDSSSEGRDSSTPKSKPKPLSENGAAKAEEQTEAPYTPRFRIPSPPPPINGIRSDPPLYFTHKLYRDAQGNPVTVHYCKNFEQAEELCKPFLNEKVVGFDMEWESYATANDTIKKNISVIQVCSESTVVIFHIARFNRGKTTEELIPPSLITLIESQDVIKTGVAVWSADGIRIKRVLNLNPRGLVELSHFFYVLQNMKTASGTYPRRTSALAGQVKTYTGLSLLKEERTRCSQWSRDLGLAQIDYAAADAYAGLALYHIMNEKRKKLRPTPPHPRFAELGLPIEGAKEDKVEVADNGVEVVVDKGVQPAQAAGKPPDNTKLPISQVKRARRQDDAIPIGEKASGEEASKNLLDFLTTSEPCLQNWKIGFTGRFTFLSRHQAAELIARCGGEVLTPNQLKGSATLVVVGVAAKSEKLQLLYENRIPTMSETDFYSMIRHHCLVKYHTAAKPSMKRLQYLENYLAELFQSVCEITGRAPIPLGHTISSVSREMPKTIMDLGRIDGALFLYTVLKEHHHDLLKILHETNFSQRSMLERKADMQTAFVKDI